MAYTLSCTPANFNIGNLNLLSNLNISLSLPSLDLSGLIGKPTDAPNNTQLNECPYGFTLDHNECIGNSFNSA